MYSFVVECFFVCVRERNIQNHVFLLLNVKRLRMPILDLNSLLTKFEPTYSKTVVLQVHEQITE